MLNEFATTFQDYWSKTTIAQRMLFVSGTLLFFWMIGHSLAMPIVNSTINGPVSFRKAITFAETGWLMCWATGFVLGYLNNARWQQLVIIAGVLQFALLETFLVSLQAWRGVPSHYNFATLFDTVVFSVMGVGSAIYLVGMIVLLVALFGPNQLTPSLRLAFRSGTVLMIIGGLTGYFMMMNLGGVYQGNISDMITAIRNGTLIGAYQGTPEGTPGGNILVIHAMGVHGLSIAPLAAWLLTYTRLDEAQRMLIIRIVVWGLFGLVFVLSLQMLQQRPLFVPGFLLGSLLATSVVTIGGGFIAVGWYVRSLKVHYIK